MTDPRESAQLFLPPSPQSGVSQNERKSKWGTLLPMVGIATTFGTSVPVGYNIGVINAPAEYIKSWCNETFISHHEVWLTKGELDFLWASVVSIFLIGGAIGSLGGASVADRLGRKRSLFICGILFLISAIIFYFCRAADSVAMLFLGRFIVGLASGLTTSTMPMYLTELAPLALRGTLGVFCSMGVTGGVVVGQIFSLQEIFGTEDLWHYALSFYIIFVIVCFLPFPWFPESPKYLYGIVDNKEKAKRELIRLRGNNTEQVQYEINEMEQELDTKTEIRSMWSVLRDPILMLPLVLVCALQGGQQLSGINAVFYYSVSIFESAGLSPSDAKWANLGAGCINLFTAFFSPILMKSINRRPLSILSCAGSGVFLLILTFVVNYIETASWLPYACITSIFCYILFYQIGLGPIPYFIGSELFEVGPRPAAMSLGSLSSWSCNFLVGILFPVLQSAWGAWVFLPFAITCLSLTILLKFYLPETRNKLPSEIVPLVSNGFYSKPTNVVPLR